MNYLFFAAPKIYKHRLSPAPLQPLHPILSLPWSGVALASWYLEQLEGSQQVTCGGVAPVDLVVLQLRGEARWAVVLIRHLHHRFGKGAAHEVSFALERRREHLGLLTQQEVSQISPTALPIVVRTGPE